MEYNRLKYLFFFIVIVSLAIINEGIKKIITETFTAPTVLTSPTVPRCDLKCLNRKFESQTTNFIDSLKSLKTMLENMFEISHNIETFQEQSCEEETHIIKTPNGQLTRSFITEQIKDINAQYESHIVMIQLERENSISLIINIIDEISHKLTSEFIGKCSQFIPTGPYCTPKDAVETYVMEQIEQNKRIFENKVFELNSKVCRIISFYKGIVTLSKQFKHYGSILHDTWSDDDNLKITNIRFHAPPDSPQDSPQDLQLTYDASKKYGGYSTDNYTNYCVRGAAMGACGKKTFDNTCIQCKQLSRFHAPPDSPQDLQLTYDASKKYGGYSTDNYTNYCVRGAAMGACGKKTFDNTCIQCKQLYAQDSPDVPHSVSATI
jgi:cytochrome c5